MDQGADPGPPQAGLGRGQGVAHVVIGMVRQARQGLGQRVVEAGEVLSDGRGLARAQGRDECELGVVAHLVLAGAEHDVIDRIGAAYARAFDRRLLAGFAGTELARRLLGVAQLPLDADLESKRGWLELSHRWLTERA